MNEVEISALVKRLVAEQLVQLQDTFVTRELHVNDRKLEERRRNIETRRNERKEASKKREDIRRGKDEEKVRVSDAPAIAPIEPVAKRYNEFQLRPLMKNQVMRRKEVIQHGNKDQTPIDFSHVTDPGSTEVIADITNAGPGDTPQEVVFYRLKAGTDITLSVSAGVITIASSYSPPTYDEVTITYCDSGTPTTRTFLAIP